MANRLKMAEQHSIIALARLGWSYRRIAAEVGVDRETVARYVRAARGDPPGSNAAISIAGSAVAAGIGAGVPDEATGDSAAPNAAIPITGSAGRRSRCEPLRAVILAKLEQGLTAQRIWQDKTLERYLRPDLVIIDDMGMKQLPKRSGEYLFEIVMRRYQVRSTMMTSSRPLEDWGKLLGDVPTATLDRFLHNSEVIAISGQSHRLRGRSAKDQPAADAATCESETK